MSKTTREKDIEKILVSEVKKLGGKAYKWTSPGNDGVPDRIVIFPNRMPVFVELKTKTGRLTPLQAVQIDRLRELGQEVEILYGLLQVRDFLEKCEHQLGLQAYLEDCHFYEED